VKGWKKMVIHIVIWTAGGGGGLERSTLTRLDEEQDAL